MNIKTIAASALTLALAASFAAPAFAQKEGKQRPSPDQRAERMIRLIDMNGDSRISRDEVTARLGDTIKTVDLNGDGQDEVIVGYNGGGCVTLEVDEKGGSVTLSIEHPA